ncbi:MAG: Acetyl esterase Axe7A precursor [Lentisphaerae bacterium ADurb.Bin082]|nr:MAG: Acetyl esterase Axe7A precursor [Lentisphaerae bacterium ADurb.Bin082]
MMKLPLSLLMGIGLGLSCVGATVDLVRNGEAKCAVVAEDDVVEQQAAAELRTYLHKITGAEVGTTPGDGLITVRFELIVDGASNALPEAAKVRDDGFLIAASESELVIASRKRRGFLYGVYQILRENGMWWLYPGEEGEVCPKADTVSVARGTKVYNPAFSDRHYRLNGGGGHVPATYDWLVRNGMQVFGGGDPVAKYDPIIFTGGHILTRLLVGSPKLADAEALLKEQPELFGLRDGERVIGEVVPTRGRTVCQPCTSNPETVRRMIASAKAWIESYGQREIIFSLCNDDHPRWCECDACAALDPPEEKAKGVYSTRWWTLVNQISAALPPAEYPNLTLNALSYMNFVDYPIGIVPDPRVRVTLCGMYRCYFHAMDDESCAWNATRYRPLFDAWGKSGMRATNFEYHTDVQGPSRYFPAERGWVLDMKYRHSLNMCGAGIVTRPPDGKFKPPWDDYRAYNMWYSLWQLHWLGAYFAWNIDADYEKVWDDVNQQYYRAGWPAMRDYRLLLEKALADLGEPVRWGGNRAVFGKAYAQPGVGRRLQALLTQAETATAADPIALSRIIREREYLEKNWADGSRMVERSSKRRAWAGPRRSTLVIDGKGNDDDWQTAPQSAGFKVLLKPNKLADPQTAVRLLYDEDNLYFLIEAEAPKNAKVKTTAKENGRQVFSDSHIEIFLGNEKHQGKYYMLAFNWDGKIYQAWAQDASGNNDFNIDTKSEIAFDITPEMLTAEIRLPLAALGYGITPDALWKVNVARSERISDRDIQLSSLCDGDFHGFGQHWQMAFDGLTSRQLIENGGFEDVGDPVLRGDPEKDWVYPSGKAPTAWVFSTTNRGKAEIRTDTPAEGKNYLHVEGSYTFIEQALQLPFSAKSHQFSYRVKVRGDGQLYLRVIDSAGTRHGDHIEQIKANEWMTHEGVIGCSGGKRLLIRTHGALDLDDVRVEVTATRPTEASLTAVSRRESAVYHAGEEVVFVVGAEDFDGLEAAQYELSCRLQGDGGLDKSWRQPFTGSEVEIPGELKEPGFVLLSVELWKNGVAVPKTKITAGAGKEVGKIRPATPEPADFDAFWADQLARLRSRPVQVSATALTVPERWQGKAEALDVRLEDGTLNATGVLVLPCGAKPRGHAAVITFSGASWIGTRPDYGLAVDGACLVFGMNLHDTINQPTPEETKELRKIVGGYQFRDPDDPEKYPMRDIFLRIVRCLDYLKTRPEWDGKTLIASGGSLGGAQALVAAALDPDVILCIANAPALCDHLADPSRQTPGWPNLLAREKSQGASAERLAAISRTMPYFDMVNFARRVRCETRMSTGFIDETCPPTTNYAVYNVLGADVKSMYNATLAGHGSSRKPGELNVFGAGGERVRKLARQAVE